MAPDIASIQWSDRPITSTLDTEKLHRAPDITFGDPSHRHVRVICIGAGIGGIFVAYSLRRSCSNLALTLYEKQSDLGGVWQASRYPNARCDVPTQNYSFPFAPKLDWDEDYASSQAQQAYMREVCDTLHLSDSFQFDSTVTDCTWNEVEARWHVTIEQNDWRFVDYADILVSATGLFSNPQIPDIPGFELFKGRKLHTSQWPSDFGEARWRQDRIAVIGNGASAVQTVPGLQPHAKHVDVFCRSGMWFLSAHGYSGSAQPLTDAEKATNRADPASLVERTKVFEDELNDRFMRVFISTPTAQAQMRQGLSKRLAMLLEDEQLAKGLTPDYPVGCRRPGFADPFLLALKQPNVSIHFTGVIGLTGDGVIGADGEERKVDTVVFATGFSSSHIPTFSIVGRQGQRLSEAWTKGPKAYMGMTVVGFPNFALVAGPNYPSAIGGPHGGYAAQADYIVQLVKKMQEEHISSFEPKQSASDAFDDWAQTQLKHTMFNNCRSYFSNKSTGRINAWPGTIPHYRRALRVPRYEDYHITYQNAQSPFAYLGRGITAEHSMEAGEAEVKLDKSPYIGLRHVDPDWLAHSTGMSVEQAREKILDDVAAEAKARAARLLDLQVQGNGGSMLVNEPFRML